MLKVKLLSRDATPPTKGSQLSAGYDLYASESTTIQPHGKGLIKTDISVAIPEGYYGRIAPRSSVAWRNHIDVGAGVIDADYRGEVGVLLFNHSDQVFRIDVGDRIAQLVIERIYEGEIKVVDNLDDTDRGDGGFGSTGK